MNIIEASQLLNKYSNLPKGQIILLQYINSEGKAYAVARDISEIYYLYSIDNNNKKLTKLRTGNSPFKFKEIHNKEEKESD